MGAILSPCTIILSCCLLFTLFLSVMPSFLFSPNPIRTSTTLIGLTDLADLTGVLTEASRILNERAEEKKEGDDAGGNRGKSGRKIFGIVTRVFLSKFVGSAGAREVSDFMNDHRKIRESRKLSGLVNLKKFEGECQ